MEYTGTNQATPTQTRETDRRNHYASGYYGCHHAKSDAYTIAKFVPSKTLMYRAAMGVYQAAQWKGR